MRAADHEVLLLAAGCSRRLAHLTQEVPKSFLPVAGRRIIDRSLDALEQLGFENVTVVVGYKQEVFRRALGAARGALRFRYVESPDYETTGHGWSLFQARAALEATGRPVLLLHADVVWHRDIVSRVVAADDDDVIAVDDRFEVRTNDEMVVLGDAGRVTGIARCSTGPRDVLGEVVGVNRFSAATLARLFSFMEGHFRAHGENHNWEPVVDAWLRAGGGPLTPLLLGGLPWVNVNHEADLRLAEDVDAP